MVYRLSIILAAGAFASVGYGVSADHGHSLVDGSGQIRKPVIEREAMPVSVASFEPTVVKVATSRAVPGACTTDLGARVRNIATRSKYAAGSSASSQAEAYAPVLAREAVWDPVRQFVRRLDHLTVSGRDADAACAEGLLADFARAGGLSRMESKDAYLTRGRVTAELFPIALRLQQRQQLSPESRVILERWMSGIAETTIDFFARQAGPMSAKNNHRYWAALSVGAAGEFLNDQALRDWSVESALIGLNQVQPDGMLPLELRRGKLARNYHVYALRPLLGLTALSEDFRARLAQSGGGALERLTVATMEAMRNPDAIVKYTGSGQAPLPQENDYTTFLRFNAESFARLVATLSL